MFYSVGKVGIGLKYHQKIQLNDNLKQHWINTNSDNNPKFIKFGKANPDVWIEPKNSLILQIKASELSKTSTFWTDYALRFPRIQAIRDDKLYQDCMSLQEYTEFYKVV